jgi:hypothetical protein
MVDNEVAALFVSESGELGCFPDHKDERFFYAGPTRWDRLSVPYSVPEPVAAGILRLIRERDEARQKAAAWEQTARELTARVKP